MDGMAREDESALLAMAEAGRNSQKTDLGWKSAGSSGNCQQCLRSRLEQAEWVCGVGWGQSSTAATQPLLGPAGLLILGQIILIIVSGGSFSTQHCSQPPD